MKISSTHYLNHTFSSIKAIIFDCDGTLIDSEQFHFLAWQTVFQQEGQTLTKEFYVNHFCGVGDVAILQIAAESLKSSSAKELLARKHQFFHEYQKAGISPIVSTVEFATNLFQQKEKRGLKLAVASGAKKKEIIQHLKMLNIEHYFEVILSGHDDLSEYQDPEGTNKPKPYVYLKAANLLGVAPHECIAIEDSKTGLASAVDAGCLAIAIPNEYTREHDLSRAHITIESFADLSVDDFFNKIASSRLSCDPR
jgi:beta-phosphoglucomutase